MRTICRLFAILLAALTSHGAEDDYQTLHDLKGRSIEARVWYVGDHWAYLQRGLKKPQRIQLSKLGDGSRSLLEEWKDAYGNGLDPEKLKKVVEAAESASKGQPFAIDPDPAKQWRLDETFSDEFNARALDPDKWERDLKPWGERAWRADNIWQKNGRVFIQAKYDRHKDKKGNEYFYTSGILRSRTTTTYGYFEARIKGCSRFPGLCPAFWLYSSGGRNPDYPHITYSEIDIVEMLQGTHVRGKGAAGPGHIDLNLHTREMIDGVETWRRPQHWPEVCKNTYDAPWDPRDGFHVYACENTPEKITWYIDGLKVAESPNHNWHLPMYVTLTMELRPPLIKWAGIDGREPVPENSTPKGFPTRMEVDYVRCWTR